MPNTDLDALKNQLRQHLEDYLTSKGINPRKPFRCVNPAHEDKHPSMSFDRKRHCVHCFACGQTYDLFHLIGMDYGTNDFPEQMKIAQALFGTAGKSIPPKREKKQPDTGAYLTAARKRLSQTDYPQQRGLSGKTAAHFCLGYDPAFSRTGGPPWQALIIPTGPDSFTARNTDPAADKRNRIRKHGASPIFNADVLRTATGPIFVVEGEIDAMSVHEAGGEAIGLGSVANAQRFLRLVTQHPPAQPLYICLDNDAEGQRASAELCAGLQQNGIPFQPLNLCGVHNDPNEALIKDRAGLSLAIREAQAAAEDIRAGERGDYLRDSAGAHIAAFLDGIASQADTPAIPTGFAALDGHLDGGLFEGLYIVGAISSLGKTTLVLQLADQLAQQGQDVLIFSLEMARYELMAKSISRETLALALAEGDTRLAKTARGITAGARWGGYSLLERDLIQRAVEAYRGYADRLFISEGIGNIGVGQVREGVARHIELLGRTPVVVIDYLQILAPYSDRATDKQNTDKAVLELKRLSRDMKVPVVGISSFNRASYREAVTMEAFKESGAIEYSSDVLIGLQLKGAGTNGFDATAQKDKNPREVELVVLKNRNGPTGRKVVFDYYPMFNCFKERG